MNQSELHETINAAQEVVWDVLFSQYGDIHVHNPTMTASSYLDGATAGAAGVVRHCEFGDKLFLDERITDVVDHRSVRIEVDEHNLPFVKDMAAVYELSAVDDETTELRMVSFNSFRPGFMKHLMGGQMRKNVAKHLFGMKYYIETGKPIDPKDYTAVFSSYA